MFLSGKKQYAFVWSVSALDERKRNVIQGIAALLQNANLKGFFTGDIYQGAGKNVCVPGLNCYSCPGAVGACPVGSLQNTLSSYRFQFPYYVVGLMIFFGALLGRAVCGFLCPFGWLQDLIHRIPFPYKVKTFKGDRPLRRLKYVVLLVMVLLLPSMIRFTPVYCKYLCPSGTLAGILLSLSNTELFAVLGGRFLWKASILALILFLSLMLYRPFCKYLCPLGAFYAFFNRISVLRLSVNEQACIHCGKCAGACGMGVDPSHTPDSGECIRCGKCVSCCPVNALNYTTPFEKTDTIGK